MLLVSVDSDGLPAGLLLLLHRVGQMALPTFIARGFRTMIQLQTTAVQISMLFQFVMDTMSQYASFMPALKMALIQTTRRMDTRQALRQRFLVRQQIHPRI